MPKPPDHPSKHRAKRRAGAISTIDLDPGQIEELCQGLRAGAPVATACALTGVPLDSVKRWMRRGRAEKHRRLKYAEHLRRNAEDDALAAPDGQEVEIRARREAEDERLRPREEPYVQALDAVQKSIAVAETMAVAALGRAMQGGDWRAAAFLLERRFGKRWGKQRLEISGDKNAPVTLDWADAVKQAVSMVDEKPKELGDGKASMSVDIDPGDLDELD